MCCDTPDRPAILGGSVRGRAAYKLIRLLLVSESERSRSNLTKPINPLLSPHVLSSDVPSNNCSTTPSNRLLKLDTPTTDGRTCKLLKMFASPSTPVIRSLSPGAKDQPPLQDQMNDENSSIPVPKRIVMSYYQSNLEWVSGHCSPLVTHSFSIDEANSLPSWSIVNEDSQSNISFAKDNNLNSGYSEPGTPTKLPKMPNRRSRTLFTEENTKNASYTKKTQSNTVSSKSEEIAKRGSAQNIRKPMYRKRCSKAILTTGSSNKQRSLLEFFKS
ncbi:unnamed protein product [Heterobilharzia americana]|nr:unnamed protein product [Heterobilharzia americana]